MGETTMVNREPPLALQRLQRLQQRAIAETLLLLRPAAATQKASRRRLHPLLQQQQLLLVVEQSWQGKSGWSMLGPQTLRQRLVQLPQSLQQRCCGLHCAPASLFLSLPCPFQRMQAAW